jgi:hypothetical protein
MNKKMNLIIYITALFCLFISSVSFSIFLIRFINYKEKLANINNSQETLTLFNYFLEKAYDIVYKDSVLIYSLEATKMNDSEFNNVSKQFGLLFLRMIGPFIHNNLINFFGDEETLMFNVIEYFNSRFETDEIRKTAVDNLAENNS